MSDPNPPQDAPKASAPPLPPKPQAEGNPAFRAMGLPRLSRLKLPSRNWLIFIGVVTSWTSALLYDRYHKKRAQRKWCALVSHLREETIPSNMMPRRITIVLAAPPGDGLRVAREHFHEYVKPILVAGAMDWEVIEGRKEGEVRAGLAEKIRRMRRREGEVATIEEGDDDEKFEKEESVRALRGAMGIRDWEGVRGDLVLGRHTWKEYVRGLHEGWLGPIDAPKAGEEEVPPSPAADDSPPNPIEESQQHDALASPTSDPTDPPSTLPDEKKPAPKPSPTPPYITPTSYTTSPAAASLPTTLPPSTAIPLPHILGFLSTPLRMYRFLHRRDLANTTGANVAALVLAAHSRPYTSTQEIVSAIDPESPRANTVPEDAVCQTREVWEQQAVLKEEEGEWGKYVWKEDEGAEEGQREKVWKEDMVVDPRIGARMSVFELPEGAEARAEELEGERRRAEEGAWVKVKRWAGYEEQRRGVGIWGWRVERRIEGARKEVRGLRHLRVEGIVYGIRSHA